ncbi:Dyp-type peroxidase [Nocardiopsis potens]|uniref:Dyp-type peroxidase n=1 Tax=Nocardiopsis potens TaxID=1246458 RepID=UPI000476C11F|nr:Dyp-type peroxidase [Nocardiopsis potens]
MGGTGTGRRGPSRRHLLLGGAAAGLGAAGMVGAGALLGGPAPQAPGGGPEPHGAETVPFHGEHQAGVETPPQAFASFLAFDLGRGTDAEAVRRLLRLLTDDASRLTRGEGALADSEPELAAAPARLTVTFGFGPGLVERVAPDEAPEWLRPLPRFTEDRLRDEWSGGDLLLQVCADDPLAVAHAARMLTKDTRAFAGLRWVQDGFRNTRGAVPEGTTMRNLMGQVDGTVNPAPGTEDFRRLVWGGESGSGGNGGRQTRGDGGDRGGGDGGSRTGEGGESDGDGGRGNGKGGAGGPEWMRGGTGLVLRRIAMDLDSWDRLDRTGREAAVGRRLSDGAPLTGRAEHDEPDFKALDPLGFPAIAEYAHIRRARSDDPAERFFRRAYNYDRSGPGGQDAGLLFAAYQHDPVRQFVPVQRRLDELDLLNEWVTAIGSAVFAVPPGCPEDGFIGEPLFRK